MEASLVVSDRYHLGQGKSGSNIIWVTSKKVEHVIRAIANNTKSVVISLLPVMSPFHPCFDQHYTAFSQLSCLSHLAFNETKQV